MDRESILQELHSERNRLDLAISALEGISTNHTNGFRKKPGPKPKKYGGITAAGRKRLSEAMKARWAARAANKRMRGMKGRVAKKPHKVAAVAAA